MSRYIERAENTARLTEVNIQLLLETGHENDDHVQAHWGSILESLGDQALFDENFDRLDTYNAAEFLTFSRKNPSSVLSCIFAARENARMIRDQISSEMWEIINRIYLFLKQQDHALVLSKGSSDFFQQIKEMSHLFRGITDATFPRQVGYEFIKAGCYLERVDKTGRILDAKHRLLEATDAKRGSAEEVVQWVSVLRSCTALEAYHRVYVGDVVPRHVVTFLVLSLEFPRSILFSLNQLQAALHAISGCDISHYSNQAERACGRVISQLVYSTVEDILEEGLHDFLAHVEGAVTRIALETGRHYMFLPIVDPAVEAVGGEGDEPESQAQSQSQTAAGTS